MCIISVCVCGALQKKSIPWTSADERVNGMTYNGNNWIVYYRKNGQLQQVREFATQNEACDELYSRVVRNNGSFFLPE